MHSLDAPGVHFGRTDGLKHALMHIRGQGTACAVTSVVLGVWTRLLLVLGGGRLLRRLQALQLVGQHLGHLRRVRQLGVLLGRGRGSRLLCRLQLLRTGRSGAGSGPSMTTSLMSWHGLRERAEVMDRAFDGQPLRSRLRATRGCGKVPARLRRDATRPNCRKGDKEIQGNMGRSQFVCLATHRVVLDHEVGEGSQPGGSTPRAGSAGPGLRRPAGTDVPSRPSAAAVAAVPVRPLLRPAHVASGLQGARHHGAPAAMLRRGWSSTQQHKHDAWANVELDRTSTSRQAGYAARTGAPQSHASRRFAASLCNRLQHVAARTFDFWAFISASTALKRAEASFSAAQARSSSACSCAASSSYKAQHEDVLCNTALH